MASPWNKNTPVLDVLDEIGRQLVPSKVQTSYMVNDVNVPTLMGVQKKHISGLDVQPLEVLMNYIRAWASKEGQSATLGKLISILERAEYGCLVHYIQQLIPEDEQTTAHSTTSAFNVEEQNDSNDSRPIGREKSQIPPITASPKGNLPNGNVESPKSVNVQSFENSNKNNTQPRLMFGVILVLVVFVLVTCIGVATVLVIKNSYGSISILPSDEQSVSKNESLNSVTVRDTMYGNITLVTVNNYEEYKRTMEQLCNQMVGHIKLTISLRLATDWTSRGKPFCGERIISVLIEGNIHFSSLIDILQSTHRSKMMSLKLYSDPSIVDYNRSITLTNKRKHYVQDMVIECKTCKELFNHIIESFEFPSLTRVVVDQEKISDLEKAMIILCATKLSSLKINASSDSLNTLLVPNSRYMLKSLISLELNFNGDSISTTVDDYENDLSICSSFPNLVCLNSTGWRVSLQSLAYCQSLKRLHISTKGAERQSITNLAYFDETLPFLEFLNIHFEYSNITLCPVNGFTGWHHLHDKTTLAYLKFSSNCIVKLTPWTTYEVYQSSPPEKISDSTNVPFADFSCYKFST